MIIPDVNLLIYAYTPAVPQHAQAKAWWEDTLNKRHPVGLPWLVIIGFIRLITNPTIRRPAVSPDDAIEAVRSWLAAPKVKILEPGDDHVERLFAMIHQAGTAGNLTTDAHLAAIAAEYGATVATNDADFLRFRGVRWFNPLTTSS